MLNIKQRMNWIDKCEMSSVKQIRTERNIWKMFKTFLVQFQRKMHLIDLQCVLVRLIRFVDIFFSLVGCG